MDQAMGMLDFFVLEAGEYLERLDALAQTPAGTVAPADEFLRVVRAFRGSALMASQQAMARAAQGLEAVARGVRDRRLAWDERVRGEVVGAVDACKALLTRVRAPAGDDAARATALAERLERVAGRPSAAPRAVSPEAGLDAGARAFVAREAAAIASALAAVARSLAGDPTARDALAALPPAMSALKGVAVLSDLPPLGDVLSGIEGAMKEVHATSGAVRPAAAEAFDAAAKTMARAAREVVDLGRPAADSEETRIFAARLLDAFARDGEIVPVETLFHDDAGPHVVRQGAPPAAPSSVEMVSLGEFLATSAGDLRRAASPAIRDLKLFGVAACLRPLAGTGGTGGSGALGRFADVGRTAVERGVAGGALDAFASALVAAALALRGAAGDEATLVSGLDAASAALSALAARPKRPTRVVPEPRPQEVRPAPGAGDLADAYVSLERLIEDHGLPLGSLAELLSGEEPGVVPIESLAPDVAAATPIAVVAPSAGSRPGTSATAPEEAAATPVAVGAPRAAARPDRSAAMPADEADVVPIETLLYGGRDALRRAIALKGEIETAIRSGETARLADLLREVFDLVGLGIAGTP